MEGTEKGRTEGCQGRGTVTTSYCSVSACDTPHVQRYGTRTHTRSPVTRSQNDIVCVHCVRFFGTLELAWCCMPMGHPADSLADLCVS